MTENKQPEGEYELNDFEAKVLDETYKKSIRKTSKREQPEGGEKSKEDFLHDEFPQIKQQVKVNPDYILDQRSLRAMQAFADQEVKKATNDGSLMRETNEQLIKEQVGYILSLEKQLENANRKKDGLADFYAQSLIDISTLKSQLQSLQAYNGKLVEALQKAELFVNATIIETGFMVKVKNDLQKQISEALSSFTDKEIKP
jgi:hypothetical protein